MFPRGQEKVKFFKFYMSLKLLPCENIQHKLQGSAGECKGIVHYTVSSLLYSDLYDKANMSNIRSLKEASMC